MTLELLTPSYRPDFERFRLLHRTVLECTDPGVVHHVVVPDADIPRFEGIGSSRLRVTGLRSMLPPSFISTQWLARAAIRIPGLPRGARFAAIDRGAPLPPIRSWILQQIVKLAVAARSDATVLLLIDSDAQLIAPIEEATFLVDGILPLYRSPAAITPAMTRHVAWHRTARRLLGMPDDGDPPYDDPIAGMIAWDPGLVRAMLDRVESIGGRGWAESIGREWEFSEYVLYAEFHQDHVPRQSARTTDTARCLSWWDPLRLDRAEADRLRDRVRPDDLALHIQSTSHTPIEECERLGRLLRRT